MSNELEHFLATQDETVSLMFLENKGDELTDILVAALEEAFSILSDRGEIDTFH
jgi:hypothetical protein